MASLYIHRSLSDLEWVIQGHLRSCSMTQEMHQHLFIIWQTSLYGHIFHQNFRWLSITHVQIVGRPLLPRFDIEILDATGSCALKYLPETGNSRSPKGDNGASSRFYTFTARLLQRGTRGWERMILNTLLRAGALMLVSSLEIVHDMYRLAYVSFGQFRVTIQLYLSFCSLSNVIEP